MSKPTINTTWISAILSAILMGYLIGFVSIYSFGEYGWTVFVLVPFFLGLVPSLVYNVIGEEFSRSQSVKMGFLTLGIFCATTLIFAVEGIICIIMASPIMGLCTFLGSLAGYALFKNGKRSTSQVYSLFLLPVLFISADLVLSSKEYLEVKTTIEIDAPIEKVWENIVSFGQIDEPNEWIFKTGIAYPTHAEIKESEL